MLSTSLVTLGTILLCLSNTLAVPLAGETDSDVAEAGLASGSLAQHKELTEIPVSNSTNSTRAHNDTDVADLHSTHLPVMVPRDKESRNNRESAPRAPHPDHRIGEAGRGIEHHGKGNYGAPVRPSIVSTPSRQPVLHGFPLQLP